MNSFSQGDIIKIDGRRNLFLIVSNNTFIQYTNSFHICPIVSDAATGPLHIGIKSALDREGIVVCEQLLLISPNTKPCSKIDSISYDQIMNISDAVQGMFEYD